mgnify:CR=1 FL=1
MLKFISLGCKVNSYESNALKELFFKNGFNDNCKPDIIVINTCSVTAVADQKSRQIIRREKRNNKDAIVVVMGCYSQKNSEYISKECGADIIVGHHPHRLQPIEKYNGKYIFYSLSNFCFGGNTGLSDPDSAIIQCEFIMDETNTYCVDYRLNVIPYSQTSTSPGNDYCPKPYEWGSEDYYRVMNRLNWAQEDE